LNFQNEHDSNKARGFPTIFTCVRMFNIGKNWGT